MKGRERDRYREREKERERESVCVCERGGQTVSHEIRTKYIEKILMSISS